MDMCYFQVYNFLFVLLSVTPTWAQAEPYNISEIQYSVCKIGIADLEATARATVTRVLKGVCNPHDMEMRLTGLERLLTDQFNVVKSMILNIEEKLLEHDKQLQSYGRIGKPKRQRNRVVQKTVVVRNEEMERLNNTVSVHNGKRQYRYYWNINNIAYKIKSWANRRSQRSESFYVSEQGYHMYMRIYPRQNGENFYIHVGLTPGEYDDQLPWPFKLKHRVQVLDFSRPSQDLASRIWNPVQLCSGWNWRRPDAEDNFVCVGLGFPNNVLHSRNFIVDNNIIVQLTVFLDE